MKDEDVEKKEEKEKDKEKDKKRKTEEIIKDAVEIVGEREILHG